VIAAKLAAGLLTGLIFGVVAEGIGFAIGYASLTGRDITYALNGSQTTLLVLGSVAGVALWGALGVGLGMIVASCRLEQSSHVLCWAFERAAGNHEPCWDRHEGRRPLCSAGCAG
jgi:hypothetical protein